MSEFAEAPAGPTLADVDRLRAEAEVIAAANPPSRVIASVLLGILTAVGWVIGRVWLFTVKQVAFCGLAIKYGYRKGAKVPVEAKKRKNIGS